MGLRSPPTGDVWIEVNEYVEGLLSFYATTATVMPDGLGAARLVVKFNLTAYVKHIIGEASGLSGDR